MSPGATILNTQNRALISSEARFLSIATRTIFLNEKGKIIERSANDTEPAPEALSYDISTVDHKREPEQKLLSPETDQLDTSPDEPSNLVIMENAETDDAESFSEKRRKTDLSIFKFYFDFINWRRATIFMVFQICLAFSSSFPGKLKYPWWMARCALLSLVLIRQSHLAQVVDRRESCVSR